MSWRRPVISKFSVTRTRTSFPIAWLVLIGAVLPFELAIYIGGAKFTPGRLVVTVLFIPALYVLSRKDRRWVLPDFFIFATAAWMLVASSVAGGIRFVVFSRC